MKPEIIKPEESNLRQQVIDARDNMLENRDLIKRIDELLFQSNMPNPNVDFNLQQLVDLLSDCKQALLRTKQEIKHKL